MRNPLNQLVQALRLIVNPPANELREMARYEEKTTCYGSASYVTRVRSRSAKNTFIVDGVTLGRTSAEYPWQN